MSTLPRCHIRQKKTVSLKELIEKFASPAALVFQLNDDDNVKLFLPLIQKILNNNIGKQRTSPAQLMFGIQTYRSVRKNNRCITLKYISRLEKHFRTQHRKKNHHIWTFVCAAQAMNQPQREQS